MNLEVIHPDLEGKMAEWYAKPKHVPILFALERPGELSKMITLKAMQVLSRASGST